MMMRKLLLVYSVVFISNLLHAQSLPFKKGDRIVFVGNSITDGGHYHSYIWLYYMTHFPTQRIDIVNAGIGGDIASQIYERLETDVFANKPNIVTLTFGMNDTGYQEFLRANGKELTDAKLQQSLKTFALIEERLKKAGTVRKIMIASSPYDETSKIKTTPFKGKNTNLLRIADAQEASARTNKWEFIDFNRPMVDINVREELHDSLFTLCGNDRIHPSNDGHLVMAYLFLDKQGFAGQKVADVLIDLKKKSVPRSQNCKITNLVTSNDRVEFNYLANSLPFPIDTVPRGGSGGMNPKKQADALAVIPFTEKFNSEMLAVSGLEEGRRYRLKIDSTIIGQWRGSELAGSINLALLTNTPQYQQALSIMVLNEERWELERRLREYYWLHYSILKRKGLLFNDSEAVYDSVKLYARRDPFVRGVMGTYQKARFEQVRNAWKREAALVTDEIYTINKPRQHHVTIELIP